MNNSNIDFIFFAGNNCVDFPKGGITSFTSQMLAVFGNRMAIVGITTDNTRTGVWLEKEFNGKIFLFFSIQKVNISPKKPLIPTRITDFINLYKYKKQILSIGIKYAFVQNSQYLLAIKNWPFQSKCYIFHGVTNPLRMPRYEWGKFLSGLYEQRMFQRLKSYDTIFAAADNSDIKKMIIRSRGELDFNNIHPLYTRFDNNVFYPRDTNDAQRELNIKKNDNYIIVQVGRISKQKGCEFLIHSFKHFLAFQPKAKLFLVGDGEERFNVQVLIESMKLTENVEITGFKTKEEVAAYYNISDLVIVGSHMEGWSISMVEALACGKPIVSTNVSGARDMIIQGQNGFIVQERNPVVFAEMMIKALSLGSTLQISANLSRQYSLDSLKGDIEKFWKPYSNAN